MHCIILAFTVYFEIVASSSKSTGQIGPIHQDCKDGAMRIALNLREMLKALKRHKPSCDIFLQ
jgi:hypothetical protein